MTRILLIRHGRTVSNTERRYSGHHDVPLDDIGLKQIEKLADRLKDTGIEAIYSSDLQRAVVTAEAVAKKHQLEVRKRKELREINFGIWESRTHDEIVAMDAKLVDDWFKDPERVTVPEGENFKDMQKRVMACFDEIIKAHPGKTVAVVAHGGVIWAALCYVLGIPANRMWRIKTQNTSITTFEFYDDDFAYVCRVNDARHLED